MLYIETEKQIKAAFLALFNIIQLLVERLFHRNNPIDREGKTDHTDDQSTVHFCVWRSTKNRFEGFVQKGDWHHCSAYKVRDCIGNCGTNICAKLFGCDGDKKCPVTGGGTQAETQKIKPVDRAREWKKEHEYKDDGRKQISHHHLPPTLKILTQQTTQQISGRQTNVRIHDRRAGDDTIDSHFLAEAHTQGHEDADDVPDRQTDKYAAQVFSQDCFVGKERKEISLAHLGVPHPFVHARLYRSQPQQQEHDPQRSADDIGHLPAH